MKLIAALLAAILIVAGKFTNVPPSLRHDDGKTDSIYSITPPVGYRDWRLISVAHEAGPLNDFRAMLGNDVAIDAYRSGTRPFPDGTIIARLSWAYDSSAANNKAFGRRQSFVAGKPINVQFSIRDSKKYALSGGWGYAQFNDDKPTNVAVYTGCFSCHKAAQNRDFVFSQYAH